MVENSCIPKCYNHCIILANGYDYWSKVLTTQRWNVLSKSACKIPKNEADVVGNANIIH